MSKSRIKKHFLIILLIIIVISVIIGCVVFGNFFSRKSSVRSFDEPTLLIIDTHSNNVIVPVFSLNITGSRKNILVITHGWIEEKLWPQDIAIAISKKVDPEQWICGWFDWRKQSMLLNPTDAAKYAKETAASILAKEILSLSSNFEHIHLIGHSAGSWTINEAADIISKEIDATIHLTFLDAYVPPFWDEKELGKIANNPNTTCWIEHYFTSDITLGATETILTNANNVDLTKINPGLNSHKFPWHWYYATVLGKYADDQRYEGKDLYYNDGTINYGFTRSLEAGVVNWEKSIKLEPNSKPVEIKHK